MSSATSTEGAAPRARVGQLFVVLSLLAATAAVLLATDTRPSHLVMISLTIGAIGAVGAAMHRTLFPLVAGEEAVPNQPAGGWRRSSLEREKALVLRSIKELEFDRAMGKVGDADFEEMGGRLRRRAAGLMAQLDELSSGYASLIERDVEARLATIGEAGAAAADETPATDEARDALQCGSCGARQAADARFCSQCGTRVRCGSCGEALVQDARFCSACGAPVEDTAR